MASERAWKNCEFVTSPGPEFSKADGPYREREKLRYGCEQLACALRMRREMQAKLLRIASLDPDYKDIDIEEISERVPITEKWSSPNHTMGNTTPTEDWSYVFHRNGTGSGPMDYSFLPIPGSHPTKLVKRQQRKDTEVRALVELLDKFGDESRLGSDRPEEVMSSRKRGLATLAFHWTNAEVFAGFHRKDLTSF